MDKQKFNSYGCAPLRNNASCMISQRGKRTFSENQNQKGNSHCARQFFKFNIFCMQLISIDLIKKNDKISVF